MVQKKDFNHEALIFIVLGFVTVSVTTMVGKFFDGTSLSFNIGIFIGAALFPLVIAYLFSVYNKSKTKGDFNVKYFGVLFMSLSLLELVVIYIANI